MWYSRLCYQREDGKVLAKGGESCIFFFFTLREVCCWGRERVMLVLLVLFVARGTIRGVKKF